MNPFFQVSFAFHDTPLPELSFPELAGRVEYFANDSAKFDLNVTGIRVPQDPIDGVPGGYVLEWEYNTDLYQAPEIALLARAYVSVSEAVAADPLVPLSVLTAAARGEWKGVAGTDRAHPSVRGPSAVRRVRLNSISEAQ